MVKKRILDGLFLILAFAVTYLLVYILDTTCLIKHIFKISCPGCGLTRAWISCFKFQFKQAFEYNAMFWSVPIIIVCAFMDWKGKRKYILTGILIAILIGFIVCWLVKIL